MASEHPISTGARLSYVILVKQSPCSSPAVQSPSLFIGECWERCPSPSPSFNKPIFIFLNVFYISSSILLLTFKDFFIWLCYLENSWHLISCVDSVSTLWGFLDWQLCSDCAYKIVVTLHTKARVTHFEVIACFLSASFNTFYWTSYFESNVFAFHNHQKSFRQIRFGNKDNVWERTLDYLNVDLEWNCWKHFGVLDCFSCGFRLVNLSGHLSLNLLLSRIF